MPIEKTFEFGLDMNLSDLIHEESFAALSENAHDLNGNKPKTPNVTLKIVGTSIAPRKAELGARDRL